MMSPIFGMAAVLAVAVVPMVSTKVTALPLPSYVEKACHIKDPNFNDCFREVGIKTLPKILPGDPKYRIPKLDPLTVPELSIRQGSKQIGINLVCKDCVISGIKNAKFTKANIELSKKKGYMTFEIDTLSISGKYNISGKVLLLPITGNGDMKINIKDISFTYKYTNSAIKKSNGLEYLKMDNFTMDHKVGGLDLHFENLFNGDKLLGDNMNKFLNENWKELVTELGPAVADALGQIIFSVLNGISELIPYKTLFPE